MVDSERSVPLSVRSQTRGDPSVCVVVPAFNEAESINGVIADIESHFPSATIVVVDDASTDDTGAAARATGHTVLGLPVNLGIGGAVQTGLKYAAERGFDIAVQVDGDGQHPADQITQLLEPILEGRADVVIGSRFLRDGGYKSSPTRRVGIKVIERMTSLLVGKRITDNTSGFRAFNRKALLFLSNYYSQDFPEPEAVIELSRNGFTITEVPVVMRERRAGKSSIRAGRSLYYITKVLMADLIAFSRRPVHGDS